MIGLGPFKDPPLALSGPGMAWAGPFKGPLGPQGPGPFKGPLGPQGPGPLKGPSLGPFKGLGPGPLSAPLGPKGLPWALLRAWAWALLEPGPGLF